MNTAAALASLLLVTALAVPCVHAGDIADAARERAALAHREAVEAKDAAVATEKTATHARGIHQGCILYSQGAEGRFPPDIATLVEGNFFTIDYTLSPFDTGKQPPADIATWPQDKRAVWVNEHTSYVILPGLTDDLDATKIAVFEKLHRADLKTIPLVYNDHHVEVVSGDEADARLRKQTGKSLMEWSGADFGAADKLYLESRFEDAIAIYRAALAKTPNDKRAADARFMLARACENLGRKKDALEAYRAFLAATPDHASAAEVKKRIAALEAAEQM